MCGGKRGHQPSRNEIRIYEQWKMRHLKQSITSNNILNRPRTGMNTILGHLIKGRKKKKKEEA